ncbi:hypothetical protein QAD02_022940 [Eretmocerus hayati]|uniref:Uncharacterized protein n=1 Tax=Eretmocerus hayati TaxID=131215 RepID=A0ACC2PWK1_9HYME|nr:hypothetical protein QAD02_022940 [Eretmocerus hayati]
MGKWYIIETIDHKRPISTDGSGSMSSSSSYGNVPITLNMCPIVTLRFIDVREGPSRISLLWEDNTGQLEYTLWVPLNKNGTIWNADIQQNGSWFRLPSDKEFNDAKFKIGVRVGSQKMSTADIALLILEYINIWYS